MGICAIELWRRRCSHELQIKTNCSWSMINGFLFFFHFIERNLRFGYLDFNLSVMCLLCMVQRLRCPIQILSFGRWPRAHTHHMQAHRYREMKMQDWVRCVWHVAMTKWLMSEACTIARYKFPNFVCLWIKRTEYVGKSKRLWCIRCFVKTAPGSQAHKSRTILT